MAIIPNLFTTPQDVFDDLGIDATQLRLDDNQQATGQTITVVTGGNPGDTTLQITALQYPLIAGSTLEFQGGNDPAVVEVVVVVTAPVGTTTLTVGILSAAVNQYATAIDNGVNAAFAARLVKGCQYATSQCMLYLCGKYDQSQLYANSQGNGSVKRWATALAKRWVCRRRGLPAPESTVEQAKEALEEMKAVQYGRMQVESIGTRTAGWPFITNATVDERYDFNRIRVEPQMSEGTPTVYPQYIDWNSALYLQF